MTYYNTTHLSGSELQSSISAARSQEEVIKEIFEQSKVFLLSPAMVNHEAYKKGYNWPLTSVRRAMTNLTKEGYLRKSEIQVTGLYGKKEYCWRLNKGQLTIF